MKPNPLYLQDIIVKRPVNAVDSGGSPIQTFSTLSTIKGTVQPISGGEPFLGGRRYTFPAYNVFCDNGNDINMNDIVTYDGSDFQITEKVVYPNTYMKIVIEKTN